VSSSSDRLVRAAALAAALLAAAAAWAAEDPARLAEKARDAARQVQIDLTPASAVDRERVARIAVSGAERGRVELERQAAERRARTEVSITISEEGLQVKAQLPYTAAAPEKPPLAGRLVVAISASMPEGMVREYARQLDGVPEAILVLRGFIGGARSVTPTVEWIERALRRHPADPHGGHYRVEVVVDPLAYQMLGITQVPAITFLPGVQDLRHCDAETLAAARLAYGAVSVRGALDALRSVITLPASLRQQLGGSP
jgi:hypothetical protein